MAYIADTISRIFSATSTTTVTNTVTPTTLFPTGVGSLTRTANWLTVGRDVNFSLGGFLSVPIGATPTITMTVNGTTVASGSVGAGLLGSFTSQGWRGNVNMACLTIGSSGTVVATGSIVINGTTVNIFNTTPVTINTTVSTVLDFKITWDSASTSRTITTNVAVITSAA